MKSYFFFYFFTYDQPHFDRKSENLLLSTVRPIINHIRQRLLILNRILIQGNFKRSWCLCNISELFLIDGYEHSCIPASVTLHLIP
jgi:hypothetical protein